MTIKIEITGADDAEIQRDVTALAARYASAAAVVTPSSPQQPATPVQTPAFPQYGQAPGVPFQPATPQQAAQAYQQQGYPSAGVPLAQPGQQAPMQQPMGSVPTSQSPAFSFDQVAVAATQLIDNDFNMQGQILGYLKQQYGADSLMQLPPEHYGAFATYLRSLGARI